MAVALQTSGNPWANAGMPELNASSSHQRPARLARGAPEASWALSAVAATSADTFGTLPRYWEGYSATEKLIRDIQSRYAEAQEMLQQHASRPPPPKPLTF